MSFGNRLIDTGGRVGKPQPIGMTYSYTIPAYSFTQFGVPKTITTNNGIAWDYDRAQLVVTGRSGNPYYIYKINFPSLSDGGRVGGETVWDITYDGVQYQAAYSGQTQVYNADNLTREASYYVYSQGLGQVLYTSNSAVIYDNTSGSVDGEGIWFGGTGTSPFKGLFRTTGLRGGQTSTYHQITHPLPGFEGGTWDNHDKLWICDGSSTIRQKDSTTIQNTGLTVASGFTVARSIAYLESEGKFAVVGYDNGTIRIFDAIY